MSHLQALRIEFEILEMRENGEEQAVKVTSEGGRGRGRATYRGRGRGRGRADSIRLLWSVIDAINLDIFDMNVLLGTKKQIMQSLIRKKKCF
ncbi:hypothetical protein U1Q18_033765 [Sarracenia purpurea var. burkii]